jgi:hypothetical protein
MNSNSANDALSQLKGTQTKPGNVRARHYYFPCNARSA